MIIEFLRLESVFRAESMLPPMRFLAILTSKVSIFPAMVGSGQLGGTAAGLMSLMTSAPF